jgi:hypothetical protein
LLPLEASVSEAFAPEAFVPEVLAVEVLAVEVFAAEVFAPAAFVADAVLDEDFAADVVEEPEADFVPPDRVTARLTPSVTTVPRSPMRSAA